MREKVSVIAGLMLVLFVAVAGAQTKKSDKYVFVISKINYLKAIEDAVVNSEGEGVQLSEAVVILCGESVKALAEDDPLVNKALQNARIRLYACGLSLEQMKVDPDLLPKGVGTVQNGILRAMKLERAGYRKYDL